ncbi:hypothetical protein [Roseomonas sp. AR75]|uniref:hypothetical protein n=1 Tax=Roseomonas sp. AR75 TaxID=2562311 RepID=UPI0010BF92C4|nr:hypothetical protein [Roseomonas sp. AR75]
MSIIPDPWVCGAPERGSGDEGPPDEGGEQPGLDCPCERWNRLVHGKSDDGDAKTSGQHRPNKMRSRNGAGNYRNDTDRRRAKYISEFF